MILVDGELAAFNGKGERTLLTFLENNDQATWRAEAIARALAEAVESGRRRAYYISEVDGKPPAESPLAAALQQAGFVAYSGGWQKRAPVRPRG